ncbi:hypothetical protein AEQU1_02360 [Aequorivita sp. CIP111184]|nr:hypothetical protein AEQU1_02360 [Aequorivita sp. CIP111184]
MMNHMASFRNCHLKIKNDLFQKWKSLSSNYLSKIEVIPPLKQVYLFRKLLSQTFKVSNILKGCEYLTASTVLKLL